jgi:hypothetical protein
VIKLLQKLWMNIIHLYPKIHIFLDENNEMPFLLQESETKFVIYWRKKPQGVASCSTG